MKKKVGRIFWNIFITVICCISAIIFMVCKWAKSTFNVGLNAIINTLFSPLKGTSSDTVLPAVKYCLPFVLIVLFICILYIIWDSKKDNFVVRVVVTALSVLSIFGSLAYMQKSYDVIGYIESRGQETNFYEENYIDPQGVRIEEPESPRNLLYIYMESMETTYADRENGGKQDINYMPECTQLAYENVYFSNKDKLGGLYPVNGAIWTMGSLFTASCALPFAFPVDLNDMEGQAQFASGVYTIGDFLEEQGYNQEFLCGSDATFAGRRTFFEQHGNYEIFDLYTAREKKYIDENYYVWWGFEDRILYEIAKDELLRLSKEEQPFNLTMLTADAHHIGGYVCKLCDNEYEDATANVIRCADKQLAEFIAWCKEQEFYENTTIVIVGDHPRMDTCLVGEEESLERTLFNCFLNTACEKPINANSREASMLDMFPTVLAGMGYHITGNRLGLGVNLFSTVPTVLEEFGRETVNKELLKGSSYYMERFAPELSYLVANIEDSLVTIYYVEENYNATEYVQGGISECMGNFSWFESDKMPVSIPISEDVENVHISIYVKGTTWSVPFRVEQEGTVICDDIIESAGVIEFDAKVIDGICEFVFLIPYREIPDDWGIGGPRAVKLTYITVEAINE